MLGKFLSSILGFFAIQANKKGSYNTAADQYLKYSPKCRELFRPYFDDLINRILNYSKEKKAKGFNFSFSDEVDLLKETIQKCVGLVAPEDLINFPIEYGRKDPRASIIALDFTSDNSLLS